jgi:hypothetical protein
MNPEFTRALQQNFLIASTSCFEKCMESWNPYNDNVCMVNSKSGCCYIWWAMGYVVCAFLFAGAFGSV